MSVLRSPYMNPPCPNFPSFQSGCVRQSKKLRPPIKNQPFWRFGVALCNLFVRQNLVVAGSGDGCMGERHSVLHRVALATVEHE